MKDATHCLTILQGLQLGGRQLRVGRPADYKAPPPNLEDYVVPLPPGVSAVPNPIAAAAPGALGIMGNPFSLPGVGGLPGLTDPSLLGALANPMLAAATGLFNPMAALVAPATVNATRVLMLKNMCTPEELASEEDVREIMDDTKEECSKYGSVVEVLIPRSGHPVPVAAGQTGDPVMPPEAVIGKIFVLFADLEGPTKAIRALNGRTFNGRKVEATFYDFDKFESRHFE